MAATTLRLFADKHPTATASLAHWLGVTKAARWESANDVQTAFPKAKVLNGERVRFDVAGGSIRLIVAFDFRRNVAFVKFVGTHAKYDRVDALSVSKF